MLHHKHSTERAESLSAAVRSGPILQHSHNTSRNGSHQVLSGFHCSSRTPASGHVRGNQILYWNRWWSSSSSLNKIGTNLKSCGSWDLRVLPSPQTGDCWGSGNGSEFLHKIALPLAKLSSWLLNSLILSCISTQKVEDHGPGGTAHVLKLPCDARLVTPFQKQSIW